jgi:type 2 lantibiotic biosynthesis protein LanM
VGATPEQRYQSFIDRLADPRAACEVLDRHPLLTQQLTEQARAWVGGGLRFASHAAADARALAERFGGGRDLGPIIQLAPGLGDAHCGGQAVAVVGFAGGTRLVYKPRSLAIDVEVQRLLADLGRKGEQPCFRLLGVLDRGDHGWMELVEQGDCPDQAAAGRYYRRVGGLLAVTWLLQGTDLHAENLIAAGEHPVLVDLEAFLHPIFPGAAEAPVAAIRSMARAATVLFSGLVPENLPDDPRLDVSGLGSDAVQTTPHPLPCWVGLGTDELRLERRHGSFVGGEALPRSRGQTWAPRHFVPELIDGFRGVALRLLERRDELLSPGGWLDRLADVEVRVLLRPTRTYYRLLDEGFHPDLLSDPGAHERHLDRLSLTAQALPHLAPAVAAERASLRRAEIPRFSAAAGSLILSSGDGEPEIEGVLDEPPLAQVRRRLAAADGAAIEREAWLLAAAFGHAVEVPPAARIGAPASNALPERCRAGAEAVAQRVAALAIPVGDHPVWYGMVESGSQHRLGALGDDLYEGLPGVALALAQVGCAVGRHDLVELGRRAARFAAQSSLDAPPERVAAAGAFQGIGGAVYAASHVAALTSDAELCDLAQRAAARLVVEGARCDIADVVGGAAGAVLALLALHRLTGDGHVLDGAVALGERLRALARPVSPGRIAWPSAAFPELAPLTGLSHGAAGCALALARLGAASGDSRFVAAARAAIAYERGCFAAELGNWPDYRDSEDLRERRRSSGGLAQATWCHGAPGIGLARVACRDLLADPEIDDEIRRAGAATELCGHEPSHGLCHGRLGNAGFLARAAEALGDQRLALTAACWIAGALDEAAAGGWRCSNPGALESPGLMTGLAGIALALARVAEPGLPDVLTLDPPAARG